MASVAYYRHEAVRCSKLADSSKDQEAAARWRAMARDYNALADELDRTPSVPSPMMHVPMQQQPVQQQQSKTQPDDKD